METAKHRAALTDPLRESSANVQPGIIHKCHGRVLLILTGACAINCRYCFVRRHFFLYAENQNSTLQWHQALDYIRNDPLLLKLFIAVETLSLIAIKSSAILRANCPDCPRQTLAHPYPSTDRYS